MLLVEIQQIYALQNIAHNNHVMVKVHRGIYDLLQAGILANKQTNSRTPIQSQVQTKPHTHGIIHHHTCNISFTLIVDDFSIKYTNGINPQHLMMAVRET